ncbi:hypothetical protein AB0I66_00395 [Streptomyces sp. NPDC050439]|uniref:hypothetical protein n=1 Tax=unclassified Streptomyces TaxID=2593676 RepID=UPI00344AA1CB
MSGIVTTLWALREGERTLAEELHLVAERHRDEQEIFHVARDVARWSRLSAERLAAEIKRQDTGEGAALAPGSVSTCLPSLAEPGVPAEQDEGALLLHDLCHLHLRASENALHWEMLAQAAQAARDAQLLEVASAGHPRSLRQMRWTNTMIKILSPQILTVPTDPP